MRENVLVKTTLVLGKVDAEGKGKVNRVELELEMREGETVSPHLTIDLEPAPSCVEVSIVGVVWNMFEGRRKDCIQAGQCVDSIREYFPDRPDVQRICELWDKCHLNDLNAGTRAQKAALTAYAKDHPEFRYNYDDCLTVLRLAGLQPDTQTKAGHSYKYGTAWLCEILPESDINELCDLFHTKLPAKSEAI